MTISEHNKSLHQALAEFRCQLRKFLLISEGAAHQAGLHPQQHQLLLAIAGAALGARPSIAYAANVMGLKHNSVVELADRCEKEGLLRRKVDPDDGRRVCLKITARGAKVLDKLSYMHLQELNVLAPHLIEALQTIVQNETQRKKISIAKKVRD